MRRQRVAFGVALCLLLASAACASPPKPLLWKATKGGTTIYLLGSLHLLQPGDYPLSRDVEGVYTQAEQVLFEIPPADMGPLAAVGPTMAYGMYADPSQSLKDDLDPATWQRVLDYARKNDLPETAIARMRPWLVTITILAKETEKLSYDPNKGLDMHLMGQVAADHKKTGGFESVTQQLQILAGTSKADQVRDLKEMLDDVPKFRTKMDELHETWRNGDSEALYREELDEFKDEPDAQRRLIDDRNRAWVPQLERMAGSTRGITLVVVGALHLLGNSGLVHLLAVDGYRTERVCTGCGNPR